MKKFTIICKNENGNLEDHTRQGKTKKEVKEMFKGNGYIVIAILSDTDIKTIKETVNNDHAQWQYSLSNRKYYKNTWWQLYVLEIL